MEITIYQDKKVRTMKNCVKRICVSVIVSVIIAASFMSVPFVHSEAFSAIDKLLVFLRDVVMLNVTAYGDGVVVVSDIANPPPDKGEVVDEAGLITLVTNGSKLDVTFTFINRTLANCIIYLVEGEPFYTQVPTVGALEEYKGFLEKYENYTGDSAVKEMENAMSTVTDLMPVTKTVGNIKLSVSENSISWKYSFNNADYTSLQVSYTNPEGNGGRIFWFSDDRSYIQIGDTAVNLTSEQAISLAAKRLENYSWSVDMGNGTYRQISDFNYNWQEAKLLTKGTLAAPHVWYPYWVVTFFMDKVYPGDVVNIIVEMWAKNGEIIDIYPLTGGGMGGPDETDVPASATPESSASIQPNASQPTASPSVESSAPVASQPSGDSERNVGVFPFLVVVAAVGAAVAGTTVVLLLRKKR
jgi:hypothetical protein